MKLLADENIALSSIQLLKTLGLDVKTLRDYGKGGSRDKDVAELAISEERMILTQDLDFGEIYYFHKRGLLGVILIRTRPQTPQKTNRILNSFFSAVDIEKENLTKTLIILEEKRYRILH
jgi:predicted nuclease of predicted toxin-antitoxin system